MRKSLSISALVVIFVAELAGLLGILYFRYTMDVHTALFDTMVGQVFDEEADVEQIRSLLYKYEYNMTAFMNSSGPDSDEFLGIISQTELEIRNQLIVHSDIMKKMDFGSEKEMLFRSVNDDVLKYLNFNAVLLSMREEESPLAISAYNEAFILPLVRKVNESIDRLARILKIYIGESKIQVENDLRQSRIAAIVGIFVIVFSIVVSIIYSHKVLRELEEKNRFFKSKSEASEMRISEIQYNTIMGIAELVESRSGETGQHVKRTSHYVNMILLQAQKKGKWADVLSARFIDNVTRAAPMHDLGKIVIPDAILNKPGKLTDEEFEVMKSHAAAGGKIVREIIGGVAEKDYVDIASDIASCHHEKWNGKGYPRGLRGEEIPLCARIMAVADVFDALVSERCYKKPMSYEKAFDIIESESGEHFDPQVVELFMELKDEIYAER